MIVQACLSCHCSVYDDRGVVRVCRHVRIAVMASEDHPLTPLEAAQAAKHDGNTYYRDERAFLMRHVFFHVIVEMILKCHIIID